MDSRLIALKLVADDLGLHPETLQHGVYLAQVAGVDPYWYEWADAVR